MVAHRAARRPAPPFPRGLLRLRNIGPRIIGFLLSLLHYQMLPEKRLAALMADLFGVSLACSSIANISRACAQRFAPFVEVTDASLTPAAIVATARAEGRSVIALADHNDIGNVATALASA